MIRNIHERLIPAQTEHVWRVLMEMGSPSDRVYPPTRWGPFHAPDGLTPGAIVYHGVGCERYRVMEVKEGRRLWFHLRGLGPGGGWGFILAPRAEGTHVTIALTGKHSGPYRWAWTVAWPLITRPLHDAEAEDTLAGIEQAITHRYARRAAWPAYTRLLRLFRPLMVIASGPGRRSLRARSRRVGPAQ